MNKMFNKKVFITGSSSSGKTTLAKKLSGLLDIPYIQFDNLRWDYDITGIKAITFRLNESDFYNNLPDYSFIIDAFPGYTSKFIKYQENQRLIGNDILMVVVFIVDDTMWYKCVLSKPWFEVNSSAFYNDYFDFWNKIYLGLVRWCKGYQFNIIYFDPIQEKEYTFEEFEKFVNERIKRFNLLQEKKENLLKHYINDLTYDKFYQDIECIKFIGYSESYKTWNIIKDMFDWKNKTVIDCGCFHGYFCLKTREAGATKVYGLEKSAMVLDTTKLIKKITTIKDVDGIEYKIWIGGDPTPKADIALVLNVLHHTDEEKTLQNLNVEYAIFEINKPQKQLIEKYYNIIKEVNSEKYDRIILYAKKIL